MATQIPLLAADFETSLDQAVAEGDTTATLLSIVDADGNNLASGLYAFTIDNNTDYKEYIVCNLVGTALTSISSISAQGAVTSGFANYHRRGASVQITDWAVLYRVTQNLSGAAGLNAAAPLYYDGTATISSANMLATKAYVDAIVNGGTVTFDQQVVPGQTAGENLTAQDSVYFKEADDAWFKTDADTLATLQNVVQGIALSTVTTGNTLQIAISGPVQLTSTTAGERYYISSTAGALTTTAPSAPAYTRLVGIGLPSNKLLLCPPSTLAQFSGIALPLSATNKVLAQADSSNGGTDQSQTTQNASTAVGQASTTGLRNKVAQSFVPTKTIIKSVNLNKQANTGTNAGNITVSIQADSAGAPSGVALATKTITAALYNAYSTGDFLAIFTSELTVTPGTTYWLVVESSTADTANCINLGTNSAGGYGSGSVLRFNATDGWVLVPTVDLYFKVNEGENGKAVLANSSGLVNPVMTQIKVKNGTVAVSTTAAAISHGFGKMPALVRGSFRIGTNDDIVVVDGSYDVANNTYSYAFGYYDEASAGSATMGTDKLVSLNAANTQNVTISAVDENVVLFVSSAGGGTIAYEVIG